MRCPACGSTAIRERPERTAQGYRRFRCRCGKQFNERSAGVLNKAQYPSDIIALVVLWRLRYKLSLARPGRDVSGPRLYLHLRGGAGVGGEADTGSGGEPPSQAQRPGRPQLVYRRDVHQSVRDHGGICIGRSIVTVPWSTSC